MPSLESPTTEPRPSVARTRLLGVASTLFYRDGIKAVGVDRIFDEAAVTRATFYRHFAGKEALVEAYLEREDQIVRGVLDQAASQATSPRHLLELAIERIADDALHNHTRGCPFINASAEYPDPESGVRKTIKRHRDWFRSTLKTALEDAGMDDPDGRAGTLVLLRDAALVGGYLDGPESIKLTFVKAARAAAGLERAA